MPLDFVRLRKKDRNRVRVARTWERGRDQIQINQGGEGELFRHVPDLTGKPIYQAFRNLADNFEARRKISEEESDPGKKKKEHEERMTFFNMAINSSCMQSVFGQVIKEGFVKDYKEFCKIVEDIWFTLYDRSGNPSGWKESCGFEHVFLGDINGNRFSGFHYWYQVFLMELDDHVKFQEFLGKFEVDGRWIDPSPEMLYVKMTFKGAQKKSGSSMFIGTSPEFEMAIYTMAYFLGLKTGEKEVEVKFGEYTVIIVCETNDQGQIEQAFAKITGFSPEEEGRSGS